MKPLIGVTTSRRGGWRSFQFHRLALYRAGARAVRLLPGSDPAFEDFAGFVIGGGDDIGAELYGGTPVLDVRIDPERDRFELQLLQGVLKAPVPILGVCRGAQMINVALGGNLHGDIHEVYADAKRMRTVLPRKQVWIEEESRLGRILDCNPCYVNALHHQAVDRLGDDLRVVGRDQAGVVQAIEGKGGHPFLVGVQWHPEFMLHSRSQQRLFRSLVDTARASPARTAAE